MIMNITIQLLHDTILLYNVFAFILKVQALPYPATSERHAYLHTCLLNSLTPFNDSYKTGNCKFLAKNLHTHEMRVIIIIM